MAKNLVFISYKHEQPWVDMAAKFRIKLSNTGDALDLDYYIDSEQISAGTPWRASVDAALAGCTHMLILLCDSYWESAECRRELETLLRRRAAGEAVSPHFVLAEPMTPQYLSLQADGQPIGDVRRVADFQFLGPFDDAQRLVPLIEVDRHRWGTSIEAMLTRLHRALR